MPKKRMVLGKSYIVPMNGRKFQRVNLKEGNTVIDSVDVVSRPGRDDLEETTAEIKAAAKRKFSRKHKL